jgi:hypothetical protein
MRVRIAWYPRTVFVSVVVVWRLKGIAEREREHHAPTVWARRKHVDGVRVFRLGSR